MLSLHDFPGFMIHRTDAKLTNYFLKQLKPYHITTEQWTVMCALYKKEKGMIQKELAEFIGKDQTTLVRIIKTMERKGLVRRKENTEDKRSHFLFLTNKGMEINEELEPLVKEINRTFVEGISDEEISQLKYILNKFYNNATKMDH